MRQERQTAPRARQLRTSGPRLCFAGGTLLRQTSRLEILATSRAPLGLDGETVCPWPGSTFPSQSADAAAWSRRNRVDSFASARHIQPPPLNSRCRQDGILRITPGNRRSANPSDGVECLTAQALLDGT